MAAIETDELTKFYGESRGVDEVSLEVERSEIFGFVGPTEPGRPPRSGRCSA